MEHTATGQAFCSQPGCPNRVKSGRCQAHQRAVRQHNRRYQVGLTAYNDPRWVAFSQRYRIEHPRCVNAGKPGCTLVTDVTDHVEPHKGDPDRFWAGPFQPMCWSCHSRKTAAESGWSGRR